MQIYVSKIITNDGPGLEFDFIRVTVNFYDNENDPHESAELEVYLDSADRKLSEIKAAAIQKAQNFLQMAKKENS